MQALIIIAVGTVIIGLIVLNCYQTRQRRLELSNWAATHGLDFRQASDSTIDDRYPNFPCLHKGDDRYAYNIMDGPSKAGTICAFDYHYETSSADSKGNRTTTNHYFSAVIVNTDVPLKPLSIRNETLFDKIGTFFGFEDINFESAEFSRQFRVMSPDRRWAFDVLTQQSMEFLLASPRFALEFYDGSVIAHRDRVFSPNDFDAALEVITGLLDRIPATVLNELKGTK